MVLGKETLLTSFFDVSLAWNSFRIKTNKIKQKGTKSKRWFPLWESYFLLACWPPVPLLCTALATSLKGSFVCPRGHIVHNWKARWFILQQNTLLYYKLEGGRKVNPPKGRILLDGCTITCPCLDYENRPVSVSTCVQSSFTYPHRWSVGWRWWWVKRRVKY